MLPPPSVRAHLQHLSDRLERARERSLCALGGSLEVRRFAGPAAFAEQLGQLRVAHLTDLHVGHATPMSVQREAVERTNRAQPDLVVITGDFVCHGQGWLDELAATIASFDAPVIATLGNHDHWSGADEVRWALRKGGALVLDNQHTVLELRRQRLQIVGLDDAYTGHADRERATRGLRRELPTIGLSHIAEQADGLWRAGVPLVLSGHTHAGQVTLAGLHELSVGRVAGHRYVHGLYGCRREQQARGAVYVGAGVGAAVVPLRIGERSHRELALFELGQLPGSFVEHHGEQTALRGRKPSASTQRKRARGRQEGPAARASAPLDGLSTRDKHRILGS